MVRKMKNVTTTTTWLLALSVGAGLTHACQKVPVGDGKAEQELERERVPVAREAQNTLTKMAFNDAIGVDRRALSVCLKEVRDEGCGDPLDTLARLASCRTAALCPQS